MTLSIGLVEAVQRLHEELASGWQTSHLRAGEETDMTIDTEAVERRYREINEKIERLHARRHPDGCRGGDRRLMCEACLRRTGD